MPSVTLIGKQFNYSMVGSGEPVFHIHGMDPVIEGFGSNSRRTGNPKLMEYIKNQFTYIAYNCYHSGGPEFAVTANSTTDVNAVVDESFVLLQHLNLSRVHLFAHRLVGYAALKLAVGHPDLVGSVALLDFQIIEPFLLKPKVQDAMTRVMQRNAMNPEYQQRMEMMRQMVEAAKSGTMPDGEPVDPEVAARLSKVPLSYFEQFTSGTSQDDPLSAQIKVWSNTILSTEYEKVASAVKQPILSVIWADGQEWTRQSSDLLKSWLAQTESFVVPKKAHWYSGENDEGLANGLIDFYSSHPLSF